MSRGVAEQLTRGVSVVCRWMSEQVVGARDRMLFIELCKVKAKEKGRKGWSKEKSLCLSTNEVGSVQKEVLSALTYSLVPGLNLPCLQCSSSEASTLVGTLQQSGGTEYLLDQRMCVGGTQTQTHLPANSKVLFRTEAT
jgi:hypothetical protein